MIGCLRTHVRKQPIIALYFESENELKFYNLEATQIVKLIALFATTNLSLTMECIHDSHLGQHLLHVCIITYMYSAVCLQHMSLLHGFGYKTAMLWLPNLFTMEFYKGIIGK